MTTPLLTVAALATIGTVLLAALTKVSATRKTGKWKDAVDVYEAPPVQTMTVHAPA